MEAVKKKRDIDMINGPFLKKLLIFALPVMASGILQLLYNTADLIIVGNFSSGGSHAQGAVSSTSSLIHLIINIFMGFAVGVNVCCARKLGARDDEGVKKAVHTAILLSLICGFFVAFVGFFLSRKFLELMSSPPEIIELSTIYLKIYFLGTPFLLLYEFGAAILRAKGETKKPLLFLTIAGVTNVVLNVFLVTVFNLSVEGVAIATVVSEILSSFLVIRYLIKTDGPCKLNLRKLKIDKKSLKEIVVVGLPAGVQGSMFSISNVIIQSSINSFGSTIVTANGNAANIEAYLNAIVNSIVQASISFVGQNYGAKRKENINKVVKDCCIIMFALCIFFGGLVVLLREPLLSIYNTDPEIILAGVPRIFTNSTTYVLFAFMQLMVGFMRGLGEGLRPMIISILGVCGIRILWIFTVFVAFPDILTIYISYPVSWLLTATAQTICFFIVKKGIFKKIDKSLEEENLSNEQVLAQ